jgi:hypothetical protein
VQARLFGVTAHDPLVLSAGLAPLEVSAGIAALLRAGGLPEWILSGHFGLSNRRTPPNVGSLVAGKSTLAKDFAGRHNAMLLVQNELLDHLFPGKITGIPGFIERSSRSRNALMPQFARSCRKAFQWYSTFLAIQRHSVRGSAKYSSARMSSMSCTSSMGQTPCADVTQPVLTHPDSVVIVQTLRQPEQERRVRDVVPQRAVGEGRAGSEIGCRVPARSNVSPPHVTWRSLVQRESRCLLYPVRHRSR